MLLCNPVCVTCFLPLFIPAGSGPSFSIPFSHFRNGANRVGVTVTHSQCGSGVMQLEFELEQLPTTPTVERKDMSL